MTSRVFGREVPFLVDAVLSDSEYISPRAFTGRLEEPEGEVHNSGAAWGGHTEHVAGVMPRLEEGRMGFLGCIG